MYEDEYPQDEEHEHNVYNAAEEIRENDGLSDQEAAFTQGFQESAEEAEEEELWGDEEETDDEEEEDWDLTA